MLGSSQWTLCVGAGISQGLAPTWADLTRTVVNTVFRQNYDADSFRDAILGTGWSLDSILQACANHYTTSGRSLVEYHELLNDVLYERVLSDADSAGLKDLVKLGLNYVYFLRKLQLIRFWEFFTEIYPDSSLLGTVNALNRAEAKGRLPVSIITFNADVFLSALLDASRIYSAYSAGEGRPAPRYKRVLRGLDNNASLRIPIFHCHGSLIPKSLNPKVSERRHSPDKLVFNETDYLTVATSSSSWAQTLFAYHAATNRMLFVGHSMSDPNIRRWLAGAKAETIANLTALGQPSEYLPHLWITREPADKGLKAIKQAGLTHLGVRVAWIQEWSDIESAIANIIGV